MMNFNLKSVPIRHIHLIYNCFKVYIKLNFVKLESGFLLTGDRMENQKRPRDPLEENSSASSGKTVLICHRIHSSNTLTSVHLDSILNFINLSVVAKSKICQQ